MRTIDEHLRHAIRMRTAQTLSAAAISDYLHSRPGWVRWQEWGRGRRYLLTRYGDRSQPLIVIAHSSRDARMARQLSLAVEQDWVEVPAACRAAYDEILLKTAGLVVIQLRRDNVCACLGHRHPTVRERPFAELHDVFGGVQIGEIDIAWRAVSRWQALPLSDTAMDTKFLEGSRLDEFHKKQLRLKLLSVVLHETHHLTYPEEPEIVIRERSLNFYREAMASYVDNAVASLSLTIDRSFSRLG
ncbi:MAG: hypothetical protein ACRD4Q_08800 [Candidatus Acidiferrales bacterium]